MENDNKCCFLNCIGKLFDWAFEKLFPKRIKRIRIEAFEASRDEFEDRKYYNTAQDYIESLKDR